jgi:hypothetical protein
LKGADRFNVKEAFGYALSGDGRGMVFVVHHGASGQVAIADAADSAPPAAGGEPKHSPVWTAG